MRFFPQVTSILALSLYAVAPSWADPAPGSSPNREGLAVRAVRSTQAIDVNGVLDEPAWTLAPAETAFFDSDPYEGSRASQRTEVRILFDNEAIYIGARMFDSRPDSLVARLSRRDVSIASDGFCVYLDPLRDKRSGYYFMINAAGTMFDGTLSNDGAQDASWDGVWHGKAHRDSTGWSAELRVPYSQLRCKGGNSSVWGINFRRSIPRRNEEAYLVYQPKNAAGFVSRFPELVGIDNLRPGRSIEVLPYFTTKASYLYEVPGDPFRNGSDYTPATGAELRTDVGRRLTLNATVNPDFGQVEVD